MSILKRFVTSIGVIGQISAVVLSLGCIDLDDAPTACSKDPLTCQADGAPITDAIVDGSDTGGRDDAADVRNDSVADAETSCTGECSPSTSETIRRTTTASSTIMTRFFFKPPPG